MNPTVDVLNNFLEIVRDTDNDVVKIELSKIISELVTSRYDIICQEVEMSNYIDKLNNDIKCLETEIKDSYTVIDGEFAESVNTDIIEEKTAKLQELKNHLDFINYPKCLKESDNIESLDIKINKIVDDIKYVEDKLFQYRDILSEYTDTNRSDIIQLKDRLNNIENTTNNIDIENGTYNLWSPVNREVYSVNSKKII